MFTVPFLRAVRDSAAPWCAMLTTLQTKWNRYLRTKVTSLEDRNYDSINHLVKLDWNETNPKSQCRARLA